MCSLTPKQLNNHHWPAEEISCSGGLLLDPKEYDTLHALILKIAKSVPEEITIKESGWHGDSYAFGDMLIAKEGSEYATCLVDTGFSCAEVGIDLTLSNDSIANAIHNLVFKILNSGKIAALLSIGCLSLIYEDLRNRNPRLVPRFVPIVFGLTNNGKTTVTDKLLVPFNAPKHHISAESTVIFMQQKLQVTYSQPIVIDDFTPKMTETEKREKVEGLIRVSGDLNGHRQTCWDLTKEVSPISTMAIVTAEDFYVEAPSSIARTLPIHVKIGECDFNAVNQLSDQIIPNFWYRFLQFYIIEEKYSDYTDSFERHRCSLFKQYGQRILPRVLDNHAVLLASWDLICQWMKFASPDRLDEVNSYTQELHYFLNESLDYQRGLISAQDEALTFLRELKYLLDSKEVENVKLCSNQENHLMAPFDSALDILEYDSFLYISVSLEEKVRESFEKKHKLSCGRTKLRQILESKGFLIKKPSSTYLSSRLTVNGKQRSFLKLNKCAVDKAFAEFE